MANKSPTYLLDVNILLALFDPHHIAHDIVHAWMESIEDFKWSSCPITENGFVRIVSNAKYTNIKSTTNEAITRLTEFMNSSNHSFWGDSVSITDPKVFSFKKQSGSKRLTDIYLIALAHQHKGKLATLDKRINSGFINKLRYDPILLVQ